MRKPPVQPSLTSRNGKHTARQAAAAWQREVAAARDHQRELKAAFYKRQEATR